MTKPAFGKWIEIKDGEIPPENDEWYHWLGYAYSEENGVFLAHHNGCDFFDNLWNELVENVTHYMMPCPKPEEGDAFTELRHILNYDDEAAGYFGKRAYTHEELILKIREVIE